MRIFPRNSNNRTRPTPKVSAPIYRARQYSTSLFSNHPLESFYQVKKTPELRATFSEADHLKDQIQEHQSRINGNLSEIIQNKLRYSWTYHSNAIEGSQLTLGDTIFFLQEGLTVEGKPFKDFLDARNHSKAIDHLLDVVKGNALVDSHFLKSLNAILLQGIDFIPGRDAHGQSIQKRVYPGSYKTEPNYVLQPDDTIFEYVDPMDVPYQVEDLCDWVQANIENEHPIITSSIAHYNHVRIHPFQDGNGRGARIFMNLILMHHRYHPAIIDIRERADYLKCLKKADGGDLGAFAHFIGNAVIKTQRTILNEIEKYLDSKDAPSPGL